MSLLDELNNLLEEEGGSLNAYEVSEYISDVEKVDDEYLGSGRWTEHHRAVFKRGEEYVALDYELPATEMQEGSEGESEVYAVEPYEVTVTKYRKVENAST